MKTKAAAYISGHRIEIDEAYPFLVVSENGLKKGTPISVHSTGESAVEYCKRMNSNFKAWWTLNREELALAESNGEMDPDFQCWVYVWTPETGTLTLYKPVETSTWA